jgi:hypothetical protein
MDDNFRSQMREEMNQLRDGFQKDRAEGKFLDYVVERYDKVRREQRNVEYRDSELEYHKDCETTRGDESKSISYENDEGGN